MKTCEVLAHVRKLLEEENALVLGTADADGVPSSAPLFFCADAELNLYWLSSPKSVHSQNLAVRNEASVSVFASVREWQAIRGVQMRGICSKVDDPEMLMTYRHRFELGSELDAVIAASAMYRFRPNWLRYSDNTFGFGFRTELTLPAALLAEGIAGPDIT